jgi:hypothetical protein
LDHKEYTFGLNLDSDSDMLDDQEHLAVTQNGSHLNRRLVSEARVQKSPTLKLFLVVFRDQRGILKYSSIGESSDQFATRIWLRERGKSKWSMSASSSRPTSLLRDDRQGWTFPSDWQTILLHLSSFDKGETEIVSS